ncbi:MAG: GNAT family N-acetyltransferase [Planctomycetota bacterium]|nr:GNAT family N-acetyltransferase [Planctomycetota bacterium]
MDLVDYTAADSTDIVSLMNLALGRTTEVQRDAAYWHWKHECNPYGHSLILLAKVAGQLVGMRSFMRWNLRVQDQIVPVAKPVDTVTHPEFQRRGIFRMLTQAACQRAATAGVCFLFNTPNRNSLPGYLQLGWREVGRLPVRVRPRRPLVIATGLLRSWFGGTRPAVRQRCKCTAPTAAEVLADRVEIETLLATLPVRTSATTVRNYPWLRWRYGEHPHADYRAVVFREGGELAGLAFCRMRRRRGLTEAILDDVLVREDREETMAALIQQLLRAIGADYIVAHAGHHGPFGRLWRRCAWPAPRRTSLSLLGRAIGPLPAGWDAFDQAQWNLCLGDLEGL